MRSASAVFVATALLACNPRATGGSAEPVAETPPSTTAAEQPASSAVVELFTSEGCSSCPPAEANLAALTDASKAGEPGVLTLELHVDYWDDLGWVDPFSSPLHSLRQRAYAAHFGASGLYTPQMIVNGQEQLVGSDRAGARAAIERALRTPSRATISLSAQRTTAGVELSYDVTTPLGLDLQLAIAADSVETHVTRGENAGRQLRHRHVVRAFQTRHLETSGSGKWLATLNAADARRGLFAAVYATDPHDLTIVGAASRSLAAGN